MDENDKKFVPVEARPAQYIAARPAFIQPMKALVSPILVREDPLKQAREAGFAKLKLLHFGVKSDYDVMVEQAKEKKAKERAARKFAKEEADRAAGILPSKKTPEEKKKEKAERKKWESFDLTGVRNDGVAALPGTFVPMLPKVLEAHKLSDGELLRATNGENVHGKGMKALFLANGGASYIAQYTEIAGAFDAWRRDVLARVAGIRPIKVDPNGPCKVIRKLLPGETIAVTPKQTFAEAQAIREGALEKHVTILAEEEWFNSPIRKVQ